MSSELAADRFSASDGRRSVPPAKQAVVIYTHSLLGSSMTFIASHAEALTRYLAVYAGSRRIDWLRLPNGRAFTMNDGGMSGLVDELLFRRFGRSGALASTLSHFKPTLVHAHFGLSAPAALDLAKGLQVPLVVTFHGQDATISDDEARRSWRGREYLRGRERVMADASRIIAVSDFIRSSLLDSGFPAIKVVTHRNGIDLAYFQPQSGSREMIVVFVGRFVEKKGCEFLVRALGVLRSQGCPIRGVLIGDGPLRASLERLANEVRADLQFTGFLDLARVKDWIAKASVVAVPSVTASDGNCEGLPTVILEAQAMSTPVIATRHAGNPEGLVEGKSAILVDERDGEGLAKAIRYFANNPAAVEEFGRFGRQFVESNFSIEKQVVGLERIYDEACVVQ